MYKGAYVVLPAVCLPIFIVTGGVFFHPHFSGMAPGMYFFGPFFFGGIFTGLAFNLYNALSSKRRPVIAVAFLSVVAMALLFAYFLMFMQNAQYEWVII